MSMTLQEAVTKWPFAASEPNDIREATQLEATISAHMMAHRRKDKRAGPIGKLPAGAKMDNAARSEERRVAVLNAMQPGPNEAVDIAKRMGMPRSSVTNLLISLERLGRVESKMVKGTRWRFWHKVEGKKAKGNGKS